MAFPTPWKCFRVSGAQDAGETTAQRRLERQTGPPSELTWKGHKATRDESRQWGSMILVQAR